MFGSSDTLIVSIGAWLVFPVVVILLSVGLGLFIFRLTGSTLPKLLIIPTGFFVAIILLNVSYSAAKSSIIAPTVLFVVGVLGLVLYRRLIRQALVPDKWIAVSALAVYFIYIAPVLFSGEPTVTSFNFNNDPASHINFINYLVKHGYWGILDRVSTSDGYAINILSKYPIGQHVFPAATAKVFGFQPVAIYLPFIATIVAIGSFALAQVAIKAGMPRKMAAVAVFTSLAAYLTYNNAQQGYTKELIVLVALFTMVAVFQELVASDEKARLSIVLGISGAVTFSAYSYGAIPYLLIFLVLALIVVFTLDQKKGYIRKWLARALIASGAFLICMAPIITDVSTFYRDTAFANKSDLTVGILAYGALPWQHIAGVWFYWDYRVLPNDYLMYMAVAAVLLAAFIGIIYSVRKRVFGPLMLLLLTGLVWVLFSGMSAPYVDAKFIMFMAPTVVLIAFLGSYAISRIGKFEAIAITSVFIAAVLYSDYIAYKSTYLAPIERLNALSKMTSEFDGKNIVTNEKELYAKVYTNNSKLVVVPETLGHDQKQFGEPVKDYVGGVAYDLNLLDQDYIEQFDGIITRRAPTASRPPYNFTYAGNNRFYTRWVKNSKYDVVKHLSITDGLFEQKRKSCKKIKKFIDRTKPSDTVLAYERPETQVLIEKTLHQGPLGFQDPLGWIYQGPDHGNWYLKWTGTKKIKINVKYSGRYSIWLSGIFGRKMKVYVDGNDVGDSHFIDEDHEWTITGSIDLSKGDHTMKLVWGEGNKLAPGNDVYSTLRAVAVKRDERGQFIEVKKRKVDELCKRKLDWIEVIRSKTSNT